MLSRKTDHMITIRGWSYTQLAHDGRRREEANFTQFNEALFPRVISAK